MKLLVFIVIGGLLCLVHLGRTQDLKERISEIKKERAGLKISKPRKQERPPKQEEAAVAKVMTLMRDVERYRGGGKPEKWAAMRLAIFDVPPAEIPALAQKLWAEDFSPKKGWIVQALIEHWSHYDLDAAMEAAIQLKGTHHVRALQGLINPLLAQDPAQFEKFVLRNSIEQGLSVPYIEFLVNQDPRKASRFVLKMMGGPNDMTVYHLASSWTRQDPKAALRWATSLSDESREGTAGQRGEALGGVFSTWKDLDHKKALETVLELGPGSPRRTGLTVLMGHWASNDADAALDYVFEELPAEDRNHRRFLNSFAGYLGEVDADKVIAAAKRIEAPELRGGFVEEAAFRRLNHDDRALEVADLLPEGKRKDRVYKTAADNLASHGRSEATTWLESLPESRSRDAAVGALIPNLVHWDPQEALGWAASITEPPQEDSHRRSELLAARRPDSSKGVDPGQRGIYGEREDSPVALSATE